MKAAIEFIKEQEPSCFGDIELLMKDYAKQVAEQVRQECAKICDKTSHPSLAILQLKIDKYFI